MKLSTLRPARRVPLALTVSFRKSYSRQNGMGHFKNLSSTGAFLEHQIELCPQEKVHLEINTGGNLRQIAAEVIWSNSGGSGLRFLPQNERDKVIINDLLEMIDQNRDDHHQIMNMIFNRVAC